MDLNLKNKTAIVTGSSRGIGKKIAEALAKEGANIIVTATNLDKASQVAEELKSSYNIETLALQHDAKSSESCKEVIAKTIEKFNSIDILVNNAGITKDMLVIQMDDSAWNDVISTNLSGAFYMSREAAKTMLRARKGKIINISSVIGKMGNAGQVNYAAAKAGIIGITKSMAKEFAPRNICVNAIAPGFIQTDMTDVLSEDTVKGIMSITPLKRLGTPEDVANLVLFLSSDMSSYITGEVIAVDGGMSM
ncbi:3-oxoacyl-[acyl-carrier-protein] reductase [Brachyspira innocens]|uniref:3-oxoacyl-[acyl-carrier-protein] reductase n=1 Tax=Brachyspira innocens TaxID=13264 RepID=A0ABT8YYL5_9SPIR|nr:3-oxoacyl-[acyl-carrier-protein] reductase [Brachyspira innocens]MDO6993690.1 3-oxoacyl-[acyl-carrier-protein] reductase [Brachyspira innocens]MDO7020977.1 3-oxoacyl-[acyl-carrier-protein] reductase [Brachyspira innocens]